MGSCYSLIYNKSNSITSIQLKTFLFKYRGWKSGMFISVKKLKINMTLKCRSYVVFKFLSSISWIARV